MIGSINALARGPQFMIKEKRTKGEEEEIEK